MKRNRRGSGLIEFALGFSVLVVLFTGMAQLAYSVIVLNQLTSAVQAGARYASTLRFEDSSERFTDEVRSFVVFGSAEPEVADAQAPGLRPENVSVTWTRDAAGAPETVTVSVENYELPVLFRRHKLDGRPAATVRYAGSWSPLGRVRR